MEGGHMDTVLFLNSGLDTIGDFRILDHFAVEE